MTMTKSYLEIELRYKVHDVQVLLDKLKKLHIRVDRQEHLIDEWFHPDTVTNLAEQRAWFDDEHGIAWRIRRTQQADRSWALDVTSKQLTEDDNHNSFHETAATFASYEAAVQAMADRDYYNWLTIDKTRYFLTSSNPNIPDAEFELVLDHIAGLADKIGVGACLEIEYKGTEQRQEALKKIKAVAQQLGFSDSDLFEKSLTVTSMTELAHF